MIFYILKCITFECYLSRKVLIYQAELKGKTLVYPAFYYSILQINSYRSLTVSLSFKVCQHSL